MRNRMRKRIRHLISVALLAGIALYGAPGSSAQVRHRGSASDRQIDLLLRRIESGSNRFRQRLDASLDRSRLDGTRQEDNINQLVGSFETATRSLRDRFQERREVAGDVTVVLEHASRIDNFMRRYSLEAAVERDWLTLRSDLTLLARYYNVTWRWDAPVSGLPAINRLTGTYRLDRLRSDNLASTADRATRGLTAEQRTRVRQIIMRRLEAPESLAIDRNGFSITVASSQARPVIFEADGRERIEAGRRPGRSTRVSAALQGDQLVVSSSGNRNRGFRVSFDSINNGRQLRVSRRVDMPLLAQPVTAISIYTKTSEVAQLDLYRGYSPVQAPLAGRYIVPDGTQLVATLDRTLTTRTTREGDTFSLMVQSPPQYRGAVIEGYVSEVDRGGRLAGRADLTLHFERIRLRNGATYTFEGYIENVLTPNGDNVRIDNEGMLSGGSQTSRTATRSGIGAAIGALIGALADGLEGAAIGAAIGAGAGAGSLFIEGRNDLDLLRDTRFVIRASSPDYRED